MIIISLFLYLLFSLILSKVLFKTTTLPKLVIAFYLSFFSINVLVFETLSFFSALNNQYLFLLGQFLLCVLLGSILVWKNKISISQWDLKSLVPTKWPTRDVVSLILIIIPFLVLLVAGGTTPPNNLDSLHAHLTRIFYWIQHGSFNNWPATEASQLIYPMNAHIQGLWLFLLSGKEESFFLFQWFSLATICASLYSIARALHLSRTQSLAGCLIFLTIPVAVLQAYSSQQDLPLVTLFAIFIYLILAYLEAHDDFFLVVAALTLALALGVKQTAFIALPALVLWLAYLALRKRFTKSHLRYLALFFAFFILFSSFKYVQNLRDFRSFFGVDNLIVDQPISGKYFTEKAKYNLPRLAYNFIDFGGMSQKAEARLTAGKASLFQKLASLTEIDLESDNYLVGGFDDEERFSYTRVPPLTEDTAWLGPLCFILIPTSFVLLLLKKKRELTEYVFFATVFCISYILGIFLQRPGWDPYQGRYFILAIIPFAPLLGSIIPERRLPKAVLITALWVSFVLLSFRILTMNNTKPIITGRTVSEIQNSVIDHIPENTRIQIVVKTRLIKWTNRLATELLQRYNIFESDYYNQLFFSTTSTIDHILMINKNIGKDEAVYYLGSRDPLEYALFGVNQTRQVFPVASIDSVPSNAYLFIEDISTVSIPGFRFIDSDTRFSIFKHE